MSQADMERLQADLSAGRLDGAIAAIDPAAFDTAAAVAWASRYGYAITSDDLTVRSESQALDDETLNEIAGGVTATGLIARLGICVATFGISEAVTVITRLTSADGKGVMDVLQNRIDRDLTG